MTWELRLPIGDPDQPIDANALVDLPMALPPGDEREIAREVLLEGLLDDEVQSVGQLHERIAWMSPTERRQLVDRSRRRSDLPTIDELQFEERHERDQRSAMLTASKTSPWMLCAEPSCSAIPINEVT